MTWCSVPVRRARKKYQLARFRVRTVEGRTQLLKSRSRPTTARCGLVGLAIVLATIAVAAQARWEVDVTGSNASVDGLGGGLIYSCASNAPSRGAVAVVIGDG